MTYNVFGGTLSLTQSINQSKGKGGEGNEGDKKGGEGREREERGRGRKRGDVPV